MFKKIASLPLNIVKLIWQCIQYIAKLVFDLTLIIVIGIFYAIYYAGLFAIYFFIGASISFGTFFFVVLLTTTIVWVIHLSVYSYLLVFPLTTAVFLLYDAIRCIFNLCCFVISMLRTTMCTLVKLIESLVGLLTSRQILFPLFLTILFGINTLEVFIRSFMLPSSKQFKHYIIQNYDLFKYFILRENYFETVADKFASLEFKMPKLKVMSVLMKLNAYHPYVNSWINLIFFKDVGASSNQNKIIDSVFFYIDLILYPARRGLGILFTALRTFKTNHDMVETQWILHLMPLTMTILNWFMLIFGFEHDDDFNYFERGLLGIALDTVHRVVQNIFSLCFNLINLIPFVVRATDALTFSRESEMSKRFEKGSYDLISAKKTVGQKELNDIGELKFGPYKKELSSGFFYNVQNNKKNHNLINDKKVVYVS